MNKSPIDETAKKRRRGLGDNKVLMKTNYKQYKKKED